MSKAGIDYGMGLSYIDKETGIRYGVIHQNKISPYAFEDIMNNGTDVDFESFKEDLQSSLESAIKHELEERGLWSRRRTTTLNNDPRQMAEEIVDNLEWDGYEGTGDCTRYEYNEDGYLLQTCSDGDIFVLKSKFVTRGPFASPCAPGAVYLDDATGDEEMALSYCLDSSWFDRECPCPYPVFEKDTMKCVYQPNKEAEDE